MDGDIGLFRLLGRGLRWGTRWQARNPGGRVPTGAAGPKSDKLLEIYDNNIFACGLNQAVQQETVNVVKKCC